MTTPRKLRNQYDEIILTLMNTPSRTVVVEVSGGDSTKVLAQLRVGLRRALDTFNEMLKLLQESPENVSILVTSMSSTKIQIKLQPRREPQFTIISD